MKPKYYSCLFLSLFACDQGNIQDTDRKDNLLDGPASTELINNFCKKVKDTYDKNDPSACVELTTKLVGEYANSFCSLERCQGIFKQLCEQEPTYPSQIVYDVLYALVKNKCLGDAGVRTIIQGIKEENLKVFSLLNNYVCLNRSRNETDEPARIIAESFGFIFNNTIFIPGINTFTSTPIPLQEKGITIDDLTNIWQCVRFIINNGFDTKSLKKLIKLASSGDFNEAIKAIADAGIFFKDSGDEMMNAFDKQYVNLNDAGLQALIDCIGFNDDEITSADKLKHLIPSLKNCTNIERIFPKCKRKVKVDGEFLSELAKKCPENYHKLIESINKTYFDTNDGKKDGYLQFLEEYKNVNTQGLSPLFSKLLDFFPVADFITLLENIDLNRAISLNPLIKSLKGKKFNLECLKQLINKYQDDPDTFNIVLDKIQKTNFDKNAKGDDVIQAFKGKNIQLEDDSLERVLFMIKPLQKISDCQTAIDFCCQNIKNLNGKNITAVFEKVKDDKKFGLDDLVKLWDKGNGKEKFNKILPYIPEQKLKKDNAGDEVIKTIQDHVINLNAKTLPNVLSMIDDNKKITKKKNKDVFKLCYDIELTEYGIDNIIRKCEDFKFTLDCLNLYENDHFKQFNAVLAEIPDENFETKNDGDVVVKKFQNNDIEVTKGNVRRILLLCQDGKKITNVTCLYFVFSRSCDDKEGVKALIDLVEDNSLNGNSVIWQIDTTKTYTTDTQKDFVKKFYGKIRDNTIYLFNQNIAKKFVLFTYIWYKQDSQLIDLEKKMKKNNKKEPYDYNELIPDKTILQNVGCETDEDFTVFKTALNTALGKK